MLLWINVRDKYKRSLLLHYIDYSGNFMKSGHNLLSVCYTHFKSTFIAALVSVLKVYFYYKIKLKNLKMSMLIFLKRLHCIRSNGFYHHNSACIEA